MSSTNLNLARKWRSKNFDQIVGQDLSVRMLKNGLFLDQYFPVYLFSGQRGCGKTTTARVFAAAINCENLENFRAHPKDSSFPCLNCASCQAMLAGKHPDFIEIDAASHTGVDNVRQIVDASQLLPLMGHKKIYLIDEAHMLSKAAFNAFLKILEEPPSSVLFILATTDSQKIIETVKSRCFQLFFKPVANDPLLSHLAKVCKSEDISYEEAGLSLIIKETEGSVRDALNVIEQVRFARERVTKEAVEHVLGHIDDERMLQLFDTLLHKTPQDLLMLLRNVRFNLFSADFVWKKMIEFLRTSIWLSYGVDPEWSVHYAERINQIINGYSIQRLNEILKLFYDNENAFLKTTAKHSLFEMILLQICQKNEKTSNESGSSPVSQLAASPMIADQEDLDNEDDELDDENEEDIEEEEEASGGTEVLWRLFLIDLDQLNDPLLSSVFKHASCSLFDQDMNVLTITFAKQFAFFKETIDETGHLWKPLLEKQFSEKVQFNPEFTGENPLPVSVERTVARQEISSESVVVQKRPNFTSGSSSFQQNASSQKRFTKKVESSAVVSFQGKSIDVSDAKIWKKANMISQYFPGSFNEIHEA